MIRKHLRTAKDKRPSAVAQALRSQGVKVTPGLVSVVKNGRKKKRLKSTRLMKHAEALADARRFVEHAGGVEEAMGLIEVVRRIMS